MFKRIFCFLAFVIMLIAVSCSKDNSVDDIQSYNRGTIVANIAPVVSEIYENVATNEFTRAGITGNISSWKPYFDNGVDVVDTLGLFPDRGYQIPFEVPIPKGTTATSVVVTAEGWSTKKNTTYSIYLPYNFYNRDYSKIPWDLRKIPLQKSNTDKVPAGLRMLFASDTCQSTSGVTGDTLKTSLFMKGGILQIRCSMTSTPAGVKFVKMMLASSDPNQFTVFGTLNMFKNTPDTYSSSTYGVNQELTEIVHSNHLTILLDNFEKNSSNYVVGYFTVPPCDFTGKTITAYLWDSSGNVYAGPMVSSASLKIVRHTFSNYNFSPMTLYTGTLPSLNPWEKTADVCPTCTPVAF